MSARGRTGLYYVLKNALHCPSYSEVYTLVIYFYDDEELEAVYDFLHGKLCAIVSKRLPVVSK